MPRQKSILSDSHPKGTSQCPFSASQKEKEEGRKQEPGNRTHNHSQDSRLACSCHWVLSNWVNSGPPGTGTATINTDIWVNLLQANYADVAALIEFHFNENDTICMQKWIDLTPYVTYRFSPHVIHMSCYISIFFDAANFQSWNTVQSGRCTKCFDTSTHQLFHKFSSREEAKWPQPHVAKKLSLKDGIIWGVAHS